MIRKRSDKFAAIKATPGIKHQREVKSGTLKRPITMRTVGC